MEGTVKFFNTMKRYGFINGDDGEDYFVHEADLTMGTVIHEGDRVTFKGQEGDKGKKAVEVSIASE
jgi:CspA family cold shock protein